MRPNVHLEIPELGYVIGVMLGDGYLEKRRTRTYVLRLLAKDRDFCETFSRALASTVNREAQYPIYRHDEVLYVVYGSSKSLYNLLKGDFDSVKKIIEKFPADFIRGLADSEGSVLRQHGKNPKYHSFAIKITNTNRLLLEYVQLLLKEFFKIESRIYLNVKKGSSHIHRGRVFQAKKDCYALRIGKKKDVLRFAQYIGFSILRKKAKLNDVVSEITQYPRSKNWRIFNEKQTSEYRSVCQRNDYAFGNCDHTEFHEVSGA